MGFTNRTFGLQPLRLDEAFENDLRLGRDLNVDGFAGYQPDRLTGQPPGDPHLVDPVRDLLNGCVGDHRGSADNQRCVQRNPPLSAPVPVRVDILVDPSVHADFFLPLQMPSIVSLVTHPRFRVFGEPM